MFGFKKVEPQCFGCGKKEKLSRRHMCAECEWAISQRKDLGKSKRETEDAISALQKLDETAEVIKVKAEIDVNRARQHEKDIIKAASIEAKIYTEQNIRIRAQLARAFRKIHTLESVPNLTNTKGKME